MKLQKQPSRGQTTSGSVPEQMYEEVREGLTSSRWGPQPEAVPLQGRPIQQIYDEVGEGLTPSKQGLQTRVTPPQEQSTQQMYEEVKVGKEENSHKQSSIQQTSAL